jgi:hypothetical protein
MFCQYCGTQLVTEAQFCPSCGRGVSIVRTITFESRLGKHLRLMSILWMAAGALNLLGAAAAWLASSIVLPRLVTRGVPEFVPVLVGSIALLIFIKGAVSFLAGWGLLERERWARPLALVLAFFSLFNFPLGTALGIYTMWVLLPEQSREEYARLSRAA